VLSWDKLWYGKSKWAYLLWPLSLIYYFIIVLRKWCYRNGIRSSTRFSPVVIVVGNITVGGTGKSPMVAYLAQRLLSQGLRVGLVSRGYRGQADSWPQLVTVDSSALQVGDEALMLVKQTGCLMCVGPDRVAAVSLLLEQGPLDCVISDDGLQHYALERDIEVVMLDAVRHLGNGLLLPAGPLRESRSCLQQQPFVVCHGALSACRYQMELLPLSVVNLLTGEQRMLSDFHSETVCAVAGIGHPQRYFLLLKQAGLCFVTRCFRDHHRYAADDFNNIEHEVILLTEKDAVKCQGFADQRFWVVAVRAHLNDAFTHQFQLSFEHVLANRPC